VPTDALLLTEDDLRPLAQEASHMDAAIDALERASLALHLGSVRQATFMGRQQSHANRASARLTFATGAGIDTGIRVLGIPVPDNMDVTRSANSRAYILLDGESGALLAVMDFSLLNPLRVGAAGGLAARYMAPTGARVLASLGSSQQARTQVQAVVRAVPSIKTVNVYSPTPAHRERFAAEMSGWLGVEAVAVDSVAAACADADVVGLANTSRGVVLERRQVKPGALVISMTGGQFGEDFIEGARLVFPTWEAIAENPMGREPYTAAIKAGAFTKADMAAEFGAVVAKQVDPRRSPSDIVVYEITALNVHDLAVAQWAYAWARSAGVGQPFVLSNA